MADQPSITSLRALAAKVSSAIDLYEAANQRVPEAELARAEIARAANELLLSTQDPLQRLFIISHQVTKLPPLSDAIHFSSLLILHI